MARRGRFLVLGVVVAMLLSLTPQGYWGGEARAAGNPFAGIKWIPNALPEAARQPGLEIVGRYQFVEWIGGWYPDDVMQDFVGRLVRNVNAAGGTPILAAYNIPYRDCGQYSRGGANDPDHYRLWIDLLARAIGQNRVIVLIEPDSLIVTDCLTPAQLNERYGLISYAVGVLKRNPNAAVYLDGGNHEIRLPREIAAALNAANIAQADGFFLNSTLYHPTSTEVAYGRIVSSMVGGKHFVVDTSRNGLGPWNTNKPDPWCNALGRALGIPPTTDTGDPLADAFIWLKPVWQSDGECTRDNPPAGQNFYSYAQGLVERHYTPFSDMPSDPAAATAVRELTLRGIIRGNGDGTFGPNDTTLRAQMAALIARPMYWELENWSDSNFLDQGQVDNDLWRNVRTLGHYGVAKGYPDGNYGPTSPVLYSQTILFITRALVQRGYWQQQPDNPAYFPNLPGTTERERADRSDIATYVHYTQHLGGVPDRPAAGGFTAWDQPAPRVWFAVALYRALLTAYLSPPQ